LWNCKDTKEKFIVTVTGFDSNRNKDTDAGGGKKKYAGKSNSWWKGKRDNKKTATAALVSPGQPPTKPGGAQSPQPGTHMQLATANNSYSAIVQPQGVARQMVQGYNTQEPPQQQQQQQQ
jgi:hypothetical protein